MVKIAAHTQEIDQRKKPSESKSPVSLNFSNLQRILPSYREWGLLI